ncbi:IS3 family transposase [Candidatus Saccharibacteria bacterium]|nr:IS3 family transposase [Candidatus Saccharibacteria bacterium]
MNTHKKRLKPQQKLIIANIANKTPEEICTKYHITLRTYQRIKEQYGTPNSVVRQLNRLKADYSRLEAHSKKQAEMIEVLRAADVAYSDSTKKKLIASEKLFPRFHAGAIIAALGLTNGGFYNHLYRNKKDKTWFNVKRERLKPLIREIYDASDGIYGAGKIAGALRRREIIAGEPLVREIMGELGLHGQENKKSRQAIRKIGRSTNRLIKQFDAYEPNVLWVTDFTRLTVAKEAIYLCVYIDVFSRKVVGYAFSAIADTRMVKRALYNALAERGYPKYLLIHSDQGKQYVSQEFRDATDKLEIVQSFSRPGTPADNPIAESFFSILKREEYRRHTYRSTPELKRAIEKYIDWYNNERVHSALGYRSPVEFEEAKMNLPRRKRVEG